MNLKSLRSRLRLVFVLVVIVLSGKQVGRVDGAEPVDLPQVPDGFQAELLRVAGEGEGSWISMTFDDRGRIIVGRDDVGLMRLTLADDPSRIAVEQLETGAAELKHCRGVLYAHGSLYVTATDTAAIYRLRDTDGDDRFDEVRLLKKLDYRSRYGHGANQIVPGPEGMIYFVVGNDVSFPEGTSADSPYRDPRNDWLLPNPHDAGHDDRVGYIVRTDPEGNSWEVLAGGFRNPVDLAFNADGEMFAYDADMEWDVGLPWYRPTRVNHVVSAGEFGWRWGTGKWPVHYQDSLPSTLDTGLGSPTGMTFGYRGRMPAKYKHGLFLGDWQNGRILLAAINPAGASYACEYEVFAHGAPLNVCDLEFGPDGALYFITGGRGSQSALYRVRYKGGEAVAAEPAAEVDGAAGEARALRRRLEQFHTRRDPRAIEEAWPHLDSSDRWLRFAARMAIERQPRELWRSEALGESRPLAAATALLALGRAGEATDQPELLAALHRLPLEKLDREALFAALRAYAVSFVRQGRPSEELCNTALRRLDSLYPHSTSVVNFELCELLVYLNAPGVIDRTLDLLEAAPTQEEQIHYAQALLHAGSGWEIDHRRRMLVWLQQAHSFRGGKQLPTVMAQMQTDFIDSLSDDERERFAAEIAALEIPRDDAAAAPPRPLVRQWTLEDFASDLEQPLVGRSHERARAALAAALCLKCHRLGDEGGAVGPDLTQVGRRFDARALLESILAPSKAIDPKYCDTAYILDDGKVVVGRPVQVDARRLVVETDPLTQTVVTVERAAIEETQPANISPMPTGLADVLTRDEVLDLLAYLQSGGDPKGPAFQAAAR